MPVSTAEWMPSDSMAELPVSAAATNFVTAIRELPTRAAMMTFLEDPAMALAVAARVRSLMARVTATSRQMLGAAPTAMRVHR